MADMCVQHATELCMAFGGSGPLVMGLLGAGVMLARERWRRYVTEREAAEKVAKLKAERNEHAERAQRLEVKVASMRPPPMPSISIIPEPPRDLAGDSVPPELEAADTVPPRSKR